MEEAEQAEQEAAEPGGGSKDLGTLVREYRDGTKGYELKNDTIKGEERQNWINSMDSVVMASAENKLGVRRRDMELNKEDGILTVWTGKSSPGQESKHFYRVDVTGTKVTNVKPDGMVKTYHSDIQFDFSFAGGKQ